MRKNLLAFIASFALCLPTIATNMCVKQKNGEIVKFEVDDIDEVYFEKSTTNPEEDPTIVDESETPLKFYIIDDDNVAVIRDGSYSTLKSVTIPPKVRIEGKVYTVTEIDGLTFAYFDNITDIKIPETVTKLGTSSFSRCYGLTKIEVPSSVVTIKDSTFYDCKNLREITIPNSVQDICYEAFGFCANLTPGLLIYGDGTKCYGWLGDQEKCTEVVIPDGVKKIEKTAFSYISSLKKIEIPNSVNEIESGAFRGCNGLTPGLLIYDNGTKCYGWIGDETKCTEVVIPDGVQKIDDLGFVYISSLTTVTIPESLNSIGYRAFDGCENLDVVIENSEENIKFYAYQFDYDIWENIRVESTMEDSKAFSGVKSVTFTK